MTREQIETLRMLTVKLPSRVDIHVENGPTGEQTGEFVRAVLLTLPHILPRLLDEREALLEALKNVARGTPSVTQIREALAKAESP